MTRQILLQEIFEIFVSLEDLLTEIKMSSKSFRKLAKKLEHPKDELPIEAIEHAHKWITTFGNKEAFPLKEALSLHTKDEWLMLRNFQSTDHIEFEILHEALVPFRAKWRLRPNVLRLATKKRGKKS